MEPAAMNATAANDDPLASFPQPSDTPVSATTLPSLTSRRKPKGASLYLKLAVFVYIAALIAVILKCVGFIRLEYAVASQAIASRVLARGGEGYGRLFGGGAARDSPNNAGDLTAPENPHEDGEAVGAEGSDPVTSPPDSPPGIPERASDTASHEGHPEGLVDSLKETGRSADAQRGRISSSGCVSEILITRQMDILTAPTVAPSDKAALARALAELENVERDLSARQWSHTQAAAALVLRARALHSGSLLPIPAVEALAARDAVLAPKKAFTGKVNSQDRSLVNELVSALVHEADDLCETIGSQGLESNTQARAVDLVEDFDGTERQLLLAGLFDEAKRIDQSADKIRATVDEAFADLEDPSKAAHETHAVGLREGSQEAPTQSSDRSTVPDGDHAKETQAGDLVDTVGKPKQPEDQPLAPESVGGLTHDSDSSSEESNMATVDGLCKFGRCLRGALSRGLRSRKSGHPTGPSKAAGKKHDNTPGPPLPAPKKRSMRWLARAMPRRDPSGDRGSTLEGRMMVWDVTEKIIHWQDIVERGLTEGASLPLMVRWLEEGLKLIAEGQGIITNLLVPEDFRRLFEQEGRACGKLCGQLQASIVKSLSTTITTEIEEIEEAKQMLQLCMTGYTPNVAERGVLLSLIEHGCQRVHSAGLAYLRKDHLPLDVLQKQVASVFQDLEEKTEELIGLVEDAFMMLKMGEGLEETQDVGAVGGKETEASKRSHAAAGSMKIAVQKADDIKAMIEKLKI
ncbi:hypothetical protein cyc_01572 [Cyclospora cayetanensis]|uniref:Transmembrane protein n=1 Tax=Cyclospora cayetanensis TaxID=88456 RepID=A0A1D3D336_9EIME|nr:hypothetical protein cyc_01572 [Cyclospora cayetanensis]